MPEPSPSTNGKATLRDVYDVVNRLEDKVDRNLHELAEKIDCLEAGQAKMFGGLAIVAAVWSWFFDRLLK